MGKSFSSKGFVITIDAFLSVTLVLLFIILSFFYLSQISINSWDSIDLKNTIYDSSNVLEKSLVLENAVKSLSSEEILVNLNETSKSYCIQLSILKQSDLSPLIVALKSGCQKLTDQLFSYERTLVVKSDSNFSFYVVRTEGWVK